MGLHLAERRPLLGAFLDALKLPHEDGILKEEAEAAAPVSESDARVALGALASFPDDQVRTYLNTLWLQDPERWQALEGIYSAAAPTQQRLTDRDGRFLEKRIRRLQDARTRAAAGSRGAARLAPSQ